MPIDFLTTADYAGIVVFAASGALAAARNSMDIFGFCVIALITAVGGGTLRDLVLDEPVFWIERNSYVLLALSAAVVVFFSESAISSRLRLLTWLDAVGLALFASLGATKAIGLGATPLISVMMGIVSAVFGGIIRDVVCNEIPLILKQEVYAIAAFGAAVVVVGLNRFGVDTTIAIVAGTALGFAIRAFAIVYGWSLPSPDRRPPH
ncbi:MAG: trimeric intracellular cation channel family protein [Pseudomonadota bacterium]